MPDSLVRAVSCPLPSLFSCSELRVRWSTINFFHSPSLPLPLLTWEKNTRLSTPAQLQCSRCRVWGSGNEATPLHLPLTDWQIVAFTSRMVLWTELPSVQQDAFQRRAQSPSSFEWPTAPSKTRKLLCAESKEMWSGNETIECLVLGPDYLSLSWDVIWKTD